MKIIIIILICLFFSLTITPINELFVSIPPQTQTPTTGPSPEQQSQPQPQPVNSLQTQINMLSTQITTTNTIAVEAKKKVDDIASQIDQLKKTLTEKPKD